MRKANQSLDVLVGGGPVSSQSLNKGEKLVHPRPPDETAQGAERTKIYRNEYTSLPNSASLHTVNTMLRCTFSGLSTGVMHMLRTVDAWRNKLAIHRKLPLVSHT